MGDNRKGNRGPNQDRYWPTAIALARHTPATLAERQRGYTFDRWAALGGDEPHQTGYRRLYGKA